MAVKTCSLPGCSKSCAGAPPDRLACGEMHHLLLMAGRYNPSLPHPHQPILDRNALGLCAFPSCSRSPSQAYPWCSRNHYRAWLFDFYAHLSPQQICKLPDCTRHVHVHDGGLPSEFCGWRHCQKFEMQNALQLQQRQQPLHTQQGDHGHVPSVESAMHAFEQFVDGVTPKGINVDDSFFDKHPWQVLAGLVEGDTCFVIARTKFKMKSKKNQRNWATKDHYHWKQQGKPEKKGGYTMRYLGYKVLKGKKEDAVHFEKDEYTMKEYTMKHYSREDCEPYCLLELCIKRRKGEFDIEARPQLDDSSPVDDSMDDCEWCGLVGDCKCVEQHKGEVDNVLPQQDDGDYQLSDEHPPVDDDTMKQDSMEDCLLYFLEGRHKGVKRGRGEVDIEFSSDNVLSQLDDLGPLLEDLPPLDYDIFNGLPPIKDSSLDFIFNGLPPNYDAFKGLPPIEDSSEDSLS